MALAHVAPQQRLFPGVTAEPVVQAGCAADELPWADIFDDHFLAIYRYAYARLRCQEEAEDLASQVFLEAIKGIGRYRPTDKPLLAWLYGIARNLVANRTRRLMRAGAAHSALAERLRLSGSADEAVDRIDLLSGLANLTADQRDVIVLRFISGLSTREICEALEKKPEAVYSLQVRGIAALRRHLLA